MIRTLIVGYGHWGQIVARNMLAHDHYFVSGIYDPNPAVLGLARSQNLYTFRTLEDALDATSPDLVYVAAPIGMMVESAMISLQRHCHVILAKPGPTTMREAERLASAARGKNRLCLVDYTMTRDSEFDRLCRIARDAKYVQVVAERTAVSSRSDAPVVQDLLVHDLAMMFALDMRREWRLVASRVSHDTAILAFESDDAEAHLSASSNGDEARRVFTVTTPDESARWDQLASSSGAGPFWDQLNRVSRLLPGGFREPRLMMRVTETLEEL